MKVMLKVMYDPKKDPNAEASKLDEFRRRIYGQGVWRKTGNSELEITL